MWRSAQWRSVAVAVPAVTPVGAPVMAAAVASVVTPVATAALKAPAPGAMRSAPATTLGGRGHGQGANQQEPR